jgi:hypothetical protein
MRFRSSIDHILRFRSKSSLLPRLYFFRRLFLTGDGHFRYIITVLAPVTLQNLKFGPTGFLSAALIVGGLRLVPSRPVLAGVLFGLASISRSSRSLAY